MLCYSLMFVWKIQRGGEGRERWSCMVQTPIFSKKNFSKKNKKNKSQVCMCCHVYVMCICVYVHTCICVYVRYACMRVCRWKFQGYVVILCACTFIESIETFKIWGQISVVLAFYVCYGKLFHLGSKSANLGLILSFVVFLFDIKPRFGVFVVIYNIWLFIFNDVIVYVGCVI